MFNLIPTKEKEKKKDQIMKEEEKKEIDRYGDAGHRSRCLSHAKRALYRVSYIPAILVNKISLELMVMVVNMRKD